MFVVFLVSSREKKCYKHSWNHIWVPCGIYLKIKLPGRIVKLKLNCSSWCQIALQSIWVKSYTLLEEYKVSSMYIFPGTWYLSDSLIGCENTFHPVFNLNFLDCIMRYLFKSLLAILVSLFENTHSRLFQSFKLDCVSLPRWFFLGVKYILWIRIIWPCIYVAYVFPCLSHLLSFRCLLRKRSF